MNKKPVIGIMGAIGSGKSFTASIFAQFGFAVIDADDIVTQLYRDKQFLKEKLEPTFGKKIFDDEGNLNRRYISDVVFKDKEKLKQLNDLVHPAVLAQMKTDLSDYQSQKQVKGIVLDVPLLLEVGVDSWCDYLVYIECPEQLRIERVAKRSKISQKELEKRQNSQIFLDKKKNIANYIVYNNSETSVIKKQVADVISDIFRNFGENNS